MRAFLFLAVLVSVLSVTLGQLYGSGRPIRPRPRPRTLRPPIHPVPSLCLRSGSRGPCRSRPFRECPRGSTCQRDGLFSGPGECCIDPPVLIQPPRPPPLSRCYGFCGGRISGTQCGPGYTCRNQQCCPVERDCLSDRICGGIAGLQCPRGYNCRVEDTFPDASGNCCRGSTQNDRCPPPSGRLTICQFDPINNCLSDRECPRGRVCCEDGCGKVCKRPLYRPQTSY